ncbi:MAG: CRISPR-associated endonuclease Cas1, partial [Bacillota bacterium]|nr:CRISPR-associated endonuclease Cas1 [Bacillota bacterium]
MTALYVTEEHAFVRKVGSTLAVRKADGSVVRLPLEQVDQVICIGDVSWSGGALRELSELGIGVAYIGPRGEWVGRWEPREAKTVLLRRLQFAASEDPVRSLRLARGFVAGKIRNCRSLLQRARRDGMLADDGEEGLLAEFVLKAEHADSLDELRGIEGEAAALYFRAYGRLVS